MTDDARGQTTQDFAIGIALFVIAVVLVVSFIPSILTPFADITHAEREAQAERASVLLVADHALDDRAVHLDLAALNETLEADLATMLDIGGTASVNVTLTELDDDGLVSRGGPDPGSADAASWTRIVTTDTDTCEPACRLRVRVW